MRISLSILAITLLALGGCKKQSQKPAIVTVTTLAGGGPAKAADGATTAASFFYPMDIAVDGAGNAYVADMGNNLIRKITAAGIVTTLAGGNPNHAWADGQGKAAAFNTPMGITLDAAGNLYVADAGNNMIRKITPAGYVSTLAGNTTAGSADGTGSAASFNSPHGVAVDASGNVYVTDFLNGTIRKVTPSGVVTTFVGNNKWGYQDGTGSEASFNGPYGIAIGPNNYIYVVDQQNNLIREISMNGVVTTVAGDYTDSFEGLRNGNEETAVFNQPSGIALDTNGNIYVGDLANNVVRKIDRSGNVTTYAGSGAPGMQNGPAASATFNQPEGLAADSKGSVYVCDVVNFLIRKIVVN